MAKHGANYLDTKKAFELATYVREKYTESGLADPAFAEQASETLGYRVTSGNVYGIRQAFAMPSNFARQGRPIDVKREEFASLCERLNLAEQKLVGLDSIIGSLRARIASLEHRTTHYPVLDPASGRHLSNAKDA